MESSNLQTSFIPKKNLVPGGSNGGQHRNINVLSIIALIVFITVVAISIAAFAYNIYLSKALDNAKVSLENQLTALDGNLIGTLSRLDSRIETSKKLLNGHIALSGLFDRLNQVTLQNVQFTNFSYIQKNQTATIDLNGVARSFAAVASESAIMSQAENTKYIQNPVFSGLNLDTTGNVIFTVSGTVKPSVFSYRTAMSSAASVAPQASSTTQ